LRGNACIAIALAPELFTRKNAIIYLGWVEDMLIVIKENLFFQKMEFCLGTKFIGIKDFGKRR
jgi:hypothetical protein